MWRLGALLYGHLSKNGGIIFEARVLILLGAVWHLPRKDPIRLNSLYLDHSFFFSPFTGVIIMSMSMSIYCIGSWFIKTFNHGVFILQLRSNNRLY